MGSLSPIPRMVRAIFIDAGHGLGPSGAADPGAQGIVGERTEVVEVARELVTRLRLQPALQDDYLIFGVGIETPMTLAQQVAEINTVCSLHDLTMDNSVLVSIHANKADGKASGIETWYEGGNPASSRLAAIVNFWTLDAVNAKQPADAKVKNRGTHSDLDNRLGRLAIVRDVVPTACLVEIGFVDNPVDAGIMKDPAKDDAYALGLTKGICEFLQEHYFDLANAGPFPDVSKDRWSATAIEELKNRGIMKGRDDGLFHPSDPLTREEFAAALVRALG